MKSCDLLITFASWEDRFRLGFERNLNEAKFREVLVFYFGSYASRTQENRKMVGAVCKTKDIRCTPVELDIDKPADNWRTVLKNIDKFLAESREILIDISTMPREIIWYVLWMIEQNNVIARYVYHSPREYGDDWLSREPRAPRLVYKLSGIASPSAKTVLIVTAGYDLQRVKRLLNWYEPNKSMIGVQSESRFRRNDEAMAEYNILEKEYDCEIFELNAFSEDFGMEVIREKLEGIDSSYNIIMGSLGPKITAITLYKIQRQKQEIGLIYAPSNQFNENYSTGIGQCFKGTM